MIRTLPFALLLLLAACGGAEDTSKSAPEPTAAIRSAPATLGTAGDTITVYGIAVSGSGNERAMTVQAEATLGRIVAPNGTAVGAGQVIAILRPTPIARLDTVKAASDSAAANAALARAQRLRADGLMSDADVETARAAAQAANAFQSTTSARIATLTLRAPVAGTVQALTAKSGDEIAAGTSVATIVPGGDLRAQFGADPALAQRIRPGQPIRFMAIGGPAPIETIIVGVDTEIDQVTRLASVFARVPAASGIGVGESLRGTISFGGTAMGVTIPYPALLDDGGRSYVFVVKAGVARSRDVSPGNSVGDRIQILHGLQPGERVVTEGGTALEDGMKVNEAGAGGRAGD